MDMLGNVWEWCQDIYRPMYEPQAEGVIEPANRSRVARGGSFHNNASYSRCAKRLDLGPSVAGNIQGFRLARNSKTP